MKRSFFIWFLGLFLVSSASGQSSTSYDVEFARICLIDSIAPDTINQFWRFTHANLPGEYTRDVTYDLSGDYVVEGTVLPCCSCLTEISSNDPVKTESMWGGVRWRHAIWGLISMVVFFFIFKIDKKESA